MFGWLCVIRPVTAPLVLTNPRTRPSSPTSLNHEVICAILFYTGGLVWTDKIEQLEIAQTRVIDMNAEPVQKGSKPKY